MTGGEAKRVVLGSLAVTGMLAGARDLTGGRIPKLRILVGVMAAGMALAVLSELAPVLAAAFALTIASTAIFTAGAETFGALGRVVGR